MFRVHALATAFGLSPEYIRAYLAGRRSMGSALTEAMLAWASFYPDLGPNNNQFEGTLFASLRIE